MTALRSDQVKPQGGATQPRRKGSEHPRRLPDFATAPVFSIPEASHFGRWSVSTTRRRIEDGSLEAITVAGVVRVRGDSLRALLGGGE